MKITIKLRDGSNVFYDQVKTYNAPSEGLSFISIKNHKGTAFISVAEIITMDIY